MEGITVMLGIFEGLMNEGLGDGSGLSVGSCETLGCRDLVGDIDGEGVGPVVIVGTSLGAIEGIGVSWKTTSLSFGAFFCKTAFR
jgi:hypothetical protein